MPPPGGKRTSLVSLAGNAYQLAGDQNQMARFRSTYGTGGLFSPGEPLVPVEPEKVRLWDFPVGWNYIYTPRHSEPISFAQLRALAENHDITRLAIETRKDQIEALDWQVVPRDPDKAKGRAAGDGRIKTVTGFLEHPDGVRPFGTWLREALEDLLVLDAPAFEIRRTRGGEIIGLDVIDGSTIDLLIDDTGRVPRPPAPAYEQVIHGRPWKLLTTDDLLYFPRNRRPQKVYGFSPVEQIVMTINIALRRQVMQLQHFTESNVPAGLMAAPDNWTAEQIRQFQEWFDAILAGNTAERTKLIWGPAGSKYQAFKEAPFADDFDEWLARVVCYAFSLPPTPFVHQVNRATADTAQEAALNEGLAPLMGWVERFWNHIIQDRLGHPDLAFAWAENKPVDALEQMNVLTGYVKEGIYTRNEAREILGADPDPDGDVLTVDSGKGPVPLRDAVNPPEPAPEPGAAGAPPDNAAGDGEPSQKPAEGEGAAEKAALPFRPTAQGGYGRAAPGRRPGGPRAAAQPHRGGAGGGAGPLPRSGGRAHRPADRAIAEAAPADAALYP